MDLTKVCTRCSQPSPLAAFTKVQKGKHGVGSICRGCRQVRNRETAKRIRENPELRRKSQEASNRYYQNHKPVREPLDPYVYKDRALQKKYGITLAEYDLMYVEQEGLCAICHRPEIPYSSGKPRALAVDHNHTTGAVRKLLCFRCNMKLGWVEDHLSTILEYLG